MKYLFDCDWMDPLLYDVMINTGLVPREEACELIIEAAQVPELVEAQARAHEIIGKHILARHVEEALLKARQVNPRHISLTITAPGVVRLTGIVNSEKEKLAAEEVVRLVSGVQGVENDLYVTLAPIDHLDFA